MVSKCFFSEHLVHFTCILSKAFHSVDLSKFSHIFYSPISSAAIHLAMNAVCCHNDFSFSFHNIFSSVTGEDLVPKPTIQIQENDESRSRTWCRRSTIGRTNTWFTQSKPSVNASRYLFIAKILNWMWIQSVT